MGTNYYFKPAEKPACPTCGHQASVSRLHIGKSSAGWCFSLHVYPDEGGPRNLDEWQALWSSGSIEDEYGGMLSADEMLSTITDRGWPAWTPAEGWAHFDRANYSQPGPNGLRRHRLGHNCIAHGDGTYDLIVGEFT